MYSARGDVDLKAPFKTHSMTTADSIGFGRETNLEQAERGAGVLTRRSEMTISQVLDRGETPSETHTLGDFSYAMTGDIFEVAHMKEALNLKRNRKKFPRMAPGFATVGVTDDSGVDGGNVLRS